MLGITRFKGANRVFFSYRSISLSRQNECVCRVPLESLHREHRKLSVFGKDFLVLPWGESEQSSARSHWSHASCDWESTPDKTVKSPWLFRCDCAGRKTNR